MIRRAKQPSSASIRSLLSSNAFFCRKKSSQKVLVMSWLVAGLPA